MTAEQSILSLADDYPVLGGAMLMILLIIQQYLKSKHGKNNASKLEQESNKLTKQTSEAVNRCSEKTAKVMESNMALLESISKYLEKNDIGRVSTELTKAVHMLEKVGEHQSVCLSTLDRVSSLCRSIADDIQKTDSRLVHERINGKVAAVEELVKDIKRIVLANK